MAKIATPIATAEKTKPDNFVIFDEFVEGSAGKVHLIVEYPKTQNRLAQYTAALYETRGIPFNLEAIPLIDPMYQFVYEKFPDLKDKSKAEQVKAKVSFYYRQWAAKTEQDALILALIVPKDNNYIFEREVTPYDNDDFDDEEDLPGLVSTPRIKYNLDNPVEVRLKKFYDWLKQDVSILLKFNTAFELAAVRLNALIVEAETEAGFRTSATG